MKLDPYMVARNVLSLDDKILAKNDTTGKSKTVHRPKNKNDFHWVRETDICRLLAQNKKRFDWRTPKQNQAF